MQPADYLVVEGTVWSVGVCVFFFFFFFAINGSELSTRELF